MQNEEVTNAINKEREKLRLQMLALINEWMKNPLFIREPDGAMGACIGAVTDALAEYSASYQLLNRLPPHWAITCSQSVADRYFEQHYLHLAKLAEQMQTPPGEPPEVI